MRVHIEIEASLIDQVDAAAGPRRRSDFIRHAIEAEVERYRRAEHILAAAGSLSNQPHEWDGDPAAWVRAQRRADPRRVG